jgi:hypothetical protein
MLDRTLLLTTTTATTTTTTAESTTAVGNQQFLRHKLLLCPNDVILISSDFGPLTDVKRTDFTDTKTNHVQHVVSKSEKNREWIRTTACTGDRSI